MIGRIDFSVGLRRPSHTQGEIISIQSEALSLRALLDPLLREAFSTSDPSPDVQHRTFTTTGPDGASVSMRWYTKNDSAPGSAVVFAHGGGLVAGSVEIYDPFVRQHVQWSGVPMLSVEYRLAPPARQDDPAKDVFAALCWLKDHAPDLGFDPARVALMGDSAGGGIAAAATIMARDAGVDVAGQILVFPMLDDRTIQPDPHLDGLATWTHDDNHTGWLALLGDRHGTAGVSPYSSPARLKDFAGLPPTYIEVGSLDLFRNECIEYARQLLGAGVETELHVHAGAVHGYDTLALDSPFAARWKADRVRVLTAL